MNDTVVPRIHPEYKPPEAIPRPPAQRNLFTGKPEPVVVSLDSYWGDRDIRVEEGITISKSGDSSQIIISGFGFFLGKKSERLVIRSEKKAIYEFPLFRLNEVVVASRGTSISSDLIQELCLRGIRTSFLDGSGRPYAMVTSPMLTATIHARREQILAFEDKRGLEFSCLVVAGKIKNQEKVLRYFNKHLKKSAPSRSQKIEGIAGSLKGLVQQVKSTEGNTIDECRQTLMGIEGTAGRLYWDGVKIIISERVDFFGREHRGAPDLVNSMLNYGYGILYSHVWGALMNAGLEPFAGFLHVDRPGKPSLVLDLVEEFRQPVVDRVVIAHINLGEAYKVNEGLLEAETRKKLAQDILDRLESVESFEGKKYQIRSIIQMQARNLASFLREGKPYKPFTFKW